MAQTLCTTGLAYLPLVLLLLAHLVSLCARERPMDQMLRTRYTAIISSESRSQLYATTAYCGYIRTFFLLKTK